MPRHHSTAAIPKGSSSFFRQIHFDLKLRLVHAWEVFLSSKQSANWSELSAEQSAVAINIPTFISCNKTWRAVIYINWNFLGAGDFELIAGLSSLNRDTWLGWSAMTKTNTKTKSSCIRDTWMDRLPCTNRDTRVFCISTEIDRGFWIEMLLTNLLRNFRPSLS